MTTEVIQPLEGEEGAVPSVAAKKPPSNAARNIAVFGGMVAALGGVAFGVVHFLGHKEPEVVDAKVATTPDGVAQPGPLKMPSSASAAELGTVNSASTPTVAASGSVPSIAAQDGDDARAIALRGSGNGYTANGAGAGSASATPQPRPLDPEDAPMFSGAGGGGANGALSNATDGSGGQQASYDAGGAQASNASPGQQDPVAGARANLDVLKGQLSGMMETLKRRVNAQGGNGPGPSSVGFQPTAGSQSDQAQAKPALFGSMEQSSTPTVSAHLLGDLSLLVPKGTLFLCSLKTRVITATSGFIACQTERNVLSADGKVSLLDRGAHLDGEYRIVSIKPGVTAVPVIWTRIRTKQGVVVDLDSPATDQLGASGLEGYVDNRWGERIGASVLLSLIQDAVQYVSTPKGDSGSTNVILPNTSSQGSKLAETVLNSTINIPPLLYQNQGGVVGVYVSRDLNFASVYELRPK